MRLALCVAVGCGLLAGVAAADPVEKKAEEAAVTRLGNVSIGVPDPSFAWKAVHTEKVGEIKCTFYACTSEKTSGRMVLSVEERVADTDPKRVATLKASWNSLIEVYSQERGFTDLRGARPKLDTPAPDRVQFGIVTKGPDGKDHWVVVHLVFGRHVYALRTFAETEAEAIRLAKVIETLLEGSPK